MVCHAVNRNFIPGNGNSRYLQRNERNTMNWPVLIAVGIALLALIMFLVRRNYRDEQKLEDQLKQDFRRSKDEEGDIDTEEQMH